MKLIEIDIKLIDEDTDQPRTQFDKASIEELAESISEVGLLNPIKVYKAKHGRYKIVFGNRRYKALKLLGFRKIPCILSDNTDELDIYFEQLTENIQRRDFTPVEEALGFEKLLDGKWKVSKKYLSGRLGKTEKYITNKLSLLVFGPEVRKIIHGGPEIVAGKLTEEQALGLKDVPLEYRDQLALKVARDQRSTRDVKRIAQLFLADAISPQLKERFLKLPCHELVALSVDSERRRELETSPPPAEPAATATAATVSQTPDTPPAASPLEEEFNRLVTKLPAFHRLPQAAVAAAAGLQNEEKAKLRENIAAVLAVLENHAKQWTEIKALLEKE